MGSSEEYYRFERLRFQPPPTCTCPAATAASDPAQPWPWHLRSRDELFAFVRDLGDETHEWLLAFYLTTDFRLLAVDTLGVGSVSSIDVPISRIILRGRSLGAAAFALAHNHPSGDPRPSQADIQVTRRIQAIGEGMDLHLLAHVIVAGDQMTSVELF